MTTKYCCGCQKWLSLHEFGKDKSTKDGLNAKCKACINARAAISRAKQTSEQYERASEYQKQYYRDHRELLVAQAAMRRETQREHIRAIDKRSRLKHRASTQASTSAYQARLRGQYVAPVSLDVLYARDKGVCALCGEPVNRSEASIDHIVPLSEGGLHGPDNVQLAHRSCNSRKQNG